MDPLSNVLSLLQLKTYVAGGFVVGANAGIQFGKFQGLKCYAVVSGSCWLAIDGDNDAIHLATGDCVVLPSGRPFCLATDLSSPRLNFSPEIAQTNAETATSFDAGQGCSILGGHFLLSGSHSDMLLGSLPSTVHIRTASSQAVMRSSLECVREELRDPQPGGSLVAQQLACVLLVQALRLHLQNEATKGVGWLFALADPHLKTAIACMHDEPGHPWTIQELADHVGMSRTVFAERFKKKVGMTSMNYLTHWRMLLAGHRLKNSNDPISRIAWSIGYETESAFSKAFRRVLGCSPREHRRRYEESLRSHTLAN